MQLVGALVRVVHGKMLVKVNGIEDGNELYSYQHFVVVIHFRFGARDSVASEPLQEGVVGFSYIWYTLLLSVWSGKGGQNKTVILSVQQTFMFVNWKIISGSKGFTVGRKELSS